MFPNCCLENGTFLNLCRWRRVCFDKSNQMSKIAHCFKCVHLFSALAMTFNRFSDIKTQFLCCVPIKKILWKVYNLPISFIELYF